LVFRVLADRIDQDAPLLVLMCSNALVKLAHVWRYAERRPRRLAHFLVSLQTLRATPLAFRERPFSLFAPPRRASDTIVLGIALNCAPITDMPFEKWSNVVGICQTPQSVIRLVGAILLKQDDKWVVPSFQRRVDETARRADVARRTSPRSCEDRCGLVETAFAFYKERVAVLFDPQLRQRPHCARLRRWAEFAQL
jgi:hypothetical protein